MPQVIRSLEEWRRERAALEGSRLSLGLIPTMGALHAGHRSLLERARAENDRVVLSVFVNPTQFDDPADLKAYPRTLESDLAPGGRDRRLRLLPGARRHLSRRLPLPGDGAGAQRGHGGRETPRSF